MLQKFALDSVKLYFIDNHSDRWITMLIYEYVRRIDMDIISYIERACFI